MDSFWEQQATNLFAVMAADDSSLVDTCYSSQSHRASDKQDLVKADTTIIIDYKSSLGSSFVLVVAIAYLQGTATYLVVGTSIIFESY